MPTPVQALQASVVRFYHANGNVVGAGFLVAERYVLTCAHVVTAALGVPTSTEEAPGDVIKIDFPLLASGVTIDATVVFWEQVANNRSSEDIALLCLSSAPPAKAEFARLASPLVYRDHPLLVVVFPRGHDSCVWSTGILRGPTGEGWIQFDSLMSQDRPVEKGFSGAPIWDDQLKSVVGMAVAAEKQRQSVTSAYMMPKGLLRSPLSWLQRQTLLDILHPVENKLVSAIQLAYGLCRSPNALKPRQQGLVSILDDLSRMGVGGSEGEDRLVQFAAALCLYLDTQQPIGPIAELNVWGQRFAKDFEAEKARMFDIRAKQQAQVIEPLNPVLLVSIEAGDDASKDEFYVKAWLLPNPDKYNPKTSDGASILSSRSLDSGLTLTPDQGISYAQLPVLMETYLRQLCGDNADCEIEPSKLTIYFVLPSSLLNKPIERLIPGEDEEPLGIGDEDCPQVILALQERLNLGGWKAKSRWNKTWKVTDSKCQTPSHQVFSDRTGLKEADVVGLKVATSLEAQTDAQLLAHTGTPLALWVRTNRSTGQDWLRTLETTMLNYPLSQLLKQALILRRKAKPLDAEVDYAESAELGHHLAILWDDPNRVPPKFVYSADKL